MSLSTLTTTYATSGATVYAIIRQANTPYNVWNGTALVTYSSGSLSSYAVNLTDQGGDMYAVAVPTSLPAGDYRIIYYVRAGASPATSDLSCGSQTIYWNGVAITPDPTNATLSPYALTTLANAKENMRVTSSTDDNLIVNLINQASAKIESITGRKFLARDYRHRYNGLNQRKLVVRNRPLQAVYAITYGLTVAMSVNYTGSGISATVTVTLNPEDAQAGSVKLRTISSVGVATDSTFTFAAYPTTQLMAAAISAVSGYSASATFNIPSSRLDPLAGIDLKSTTANLTYPPLNYSYFTVDNERGIIEFDNRGGFWLANLQPGTPGMPRNFPIGHQVMWLEYRAGFETIPDDVTGVCNWLVQLLYQEGNQNPYGQNESIGPYSNTTQDPLNSKIEDYIRYKLRAYMDNAVISIGGAA
jgi:hypothetical protein